MAFDQFQIEQYRALRAEIIRSMADGNQIMAFGTAAIGLIISAGMGVRESFFGFVVFASLLPLMCALILSMWFAAQQRTARASHFLCGMESQVETSGQPLWEHWLRSSDGKSQSRHFWSTEHAAIALLSLIALTSLIFSFASGNHVEPMTRIGFTSVSLALGVAVGWNMRQRFRQWRDWLSDKPNQGPRA